MNTTDSDSKRLLRRIFRFSDDRRDVAEAADVCGVSVRQVYTWMEPESRTEIPPCKLAKLSRFLVAEYNDTRIADACLPEGSVIVVPRAHAANGQVQDELVAIIEEMGGISEAWKRGDYEHVIGLCSSIVGEAARMKAEAQGRMS